jgi:hypothetical protein
MKYLIKYKLFESFDQNDEPIKVLNDICLELSDEDYSFFIQDLKGTGILNPDKISVSVTGKPNVGDVWRYKPFTYDDVRDVFERMIEYMDSEDFEILRFVYSTPEDPASHNFLKYHNGELITYNREKVDIFHHLQINFIEKETKTNESTEKCTKMRYLIKYKLFESLDLNSESVLTDEVWSDISDILLELEDEGFVVSKRLSDYKKVSNKLCEDVIEIVVNKESLNNFNYEQVKDTFMRLIDYLESYDWNYSILYFPKIGQHHFIEFECGWKDPLTKVHKHILYRSELEDSHAFKICFYQAIDHLIN